MTFGARCLIPRFKFETSTSWGLMDSSSVGTMDAYLAVAALRERIDGEEECVELRTPAGTMKVSQILNTESYSVKWAN